MILRIPISDPFLDCSRNQGSSHRTDKCPAVGAQDLSVDTILAGRRGTRGRNIRDAIPPPSFEGHDEFKKTHEIYQSARKGRVGHCAVDAQYPDESWKPKILFWHD
jgi:hypothetical protein